MDGMVSSHVDDFILARSDRFLEKITWKIAEKLVISKLADNDFRFTRMDMRKEGDLIVVCMEDYAKS